MNIFLMGNCLLEIPPMLRDSVAAKDTSEMLLQGASLTILAVAVLAWFFAWKFFKIEKAGKKYFFINLGIAILYLPFLAVHFFRCYELNFQTGTEHYLMFFFLHSVVLALWSLGFYGRNKQEESF